MRSNIAGLLLALCCVSCCAQTFQPALPGYRYEFPKDNFDHPAYQTEWWYYTGNLLAQDGHRFGFELTFFRQAVSRDQSSSPWYVHDLYMAHLALTDVSGAHYYSAERVQRAGPELAGIDPVQEVVWNGNWRTKIDPGFHSLQGVDKDFSFTLKAIPQKKIVEHGQDGVSQKAEGAGHASHYLSFTRMQTTGTLVLNGKQFAVTGSSWMDHEFFSDSMQNDEVGWDWLSIQLGDNTELMLYRLRHQDGRVDPYSSGSYVDSSGNTLHLTLSDFSMVQTGTTWHSSHTGGEYPVAWTIQIPKLALSLSVSTPLQAQEFVSHVGPSYWEGAIDVRGEHEAKPVQGEGYLEMTGYAKQAGSLFTASPR